MVRGNNPGNDNGLNLERLSESTKNMQKENKRAVAFIVCIINKH
jgi:hypothetical protein